MTTKINRRIVNTKKHTVGYILSGGKRVTRKQAIGLAHSGKIAGVRVIKGSTGQYLQSTTKKSLQTLPETK